MKRMRQKKLIEDKKESSAKGGRMGSAYLRKGGRMGSAYLRDEHDNTMESSRNSCF